VCAAAIYAGLTPVLRRMVIRKITPVVEAA
jgi:hypothetical protein